MFIFYFRIQVHYGCVQGTAVVIGNGVNLGSALSVGDCPLQQGEFVHRIELTFITVPIYGYYVNAGITFIASHKTCGHFGAPQNEGTLAVLEGNRLLNNCMTGPT